MRSVKFKKTWNGRANLYHRKNKSIEGSSEKVDRNKIEQHTLKSVDKCLHT
jgi:hypothetical protein